MVIGEVFSNPTVKQVIFQINYPNLFYLESKIGDFQLRIMDKFPDSSIIIRKNILFVDGEKAVVPADVPQEAMEPGGKIWQFKTKDGTTLKLTINSLSIISTAYKTYDKGDGEHFKDVITSAVSSFIGVINLPIMTRVGLRYIDECPILEKNNGWFKQYYRSVLAIDRFDVEKAHDMRFNVQISKDSYRLGYAESFVETPNGYKLIMDFDGSANNVDPSQYLKVLDDLHDMISVEYDLSITENLKEWMRGKK